jgi:hypothetical protein
VKNTDTIKQLNVLIQLACSDNHFVKGERDLIYEIAREKKIQDNVVHGLIRHPESVLSINSLTVEDKMSHLLDCMELIFADHILTENELLFAQGIARRLGFEGAVINFLVENRPKLERAKLISALPRFLAKPSRFASTESNPSRNN